MAGKGRRKKAEVSAGDGSIVITGDVKGSNVLLGSKNRTTIQTVNQTINIAPLFEEIYKKVDEAAEIDAQKKKDLKDELQEIQTALEKPNPDETFLTRRLRVLKRMAPEIAEVAIETLKNPIGGVAEVVKRIAKKAAEETVADAK
ncbi:MAG: hypothetical protein IH589_03540 [Anaerolineales bacterium]|nr:hypothetical protein [Anaerolineales bacterium]